MGDKTSEKIYFELNMKNYFGILDNLIYLKQKDVSWFSERKFVIFKHFESYFNF